MKAFLYLATLLSWCAAVGQARPNPAISNVSAREVRWSEDLDCFAKELPARHKDFFRLIPRTEFEAQVSRLRRELPPLSDPAVVLALKRLVAGLGIGHTRVGWPAGELAFRGYPLMLLWYSTRRYRLIRDADPPALDPDLAVPLSLGEFLAGRDPALEAALHPVR